MEHGTGVKARLDTGSRLQKWQYTRTRFIFQSQSKCSRRLAATLTTQASVRHVPPQSGKSRPQSGIPGLNQAVQASIRREVIREACSLATPPAHLVAETPRRQATALRGAVEAEHATRGQRRWQRRPSTTLPHG